MAVHFIFIFFWPRVTIIGGVRNYINSNYILDVAFEWTKRQKVKRFCWNFGKAGKFPDFVAAKGNQKFITKSDEITALSTIHPNRRCSGLLFGTVFLRFKPKTKRFLRLNHTYLPHWICQATYGSVPLHTYMYKFVNRSQTDDFYELISNIGMCIVH